MGIESVLRNKLVVGGKGRTRKRKKTEVVKAPRRKKKGIVLFTIKQGSDVLKMLCLRFERCHFVIVKLQGFFSGGFVKIHKIC